MANRKIGKLMKQKMDERVIWFNINLMKWQAH